MHYSCSLCIVYYYSYLYFRVNLGGVLLNVLYVRVIWSELSVSMWCWDMSPVLSQGHTVWRMTTIFSSPGEQMSSVVKIWLSSTAVKGQKREIFFLYPLRNLMMVMEDNRCNGRDKDLADLPGGLRGTIWNSRDQVSVVAAAGWCCCWQITSTMTSSKNQVLMKQTATKPPKTICYTADVRYCYSIFL